MIEKHPAEQIAEMTGGKITEVAILPDGSGFATLSMPLPKDHWIYDKGPEHFNVPPMPLLMAQSGKIHIQSPSGGVVFSMTRQEIANLIRECGKYAVRCATMNGEISDMDPDALLQNLVVGMIGYNSESGLAEEDWCNPPHRRKNSVVRDPLGGPR